MSDWLNGIPEGELWQMRETIARWIERVGGEPAGESSKLSDLWRGLHEVQAALDRISKAKDA